MTRLFLVLVLVGSSAGCKVRISVPEGGQVVSASGAFDCPQGQVCTVDVVDVFFDERFSGAPAAGFVFTGWRRGQDRLCGGGPRDCRLVTEGFAGNEGLMAVLESDRVFHLEPVFARQGDLGPLENRSFRACVNTAMYQSGYRSDITRQHYDDGVEEGTRRTRREVSGPQPYRGQPAMVLKEAVSDSGPLNATFELTTYHRVDMGAFRVDTVGSEQVSITPVRQEVVGVFTPPFVQRFDLQVGDEYTTEYTIELTFPDNSAPQTLQHIRSRFIYEGIQSITVPAGTFDACRVRRYDTVNGETSESYNWIGEGTGILLLESDAQFVPEAAVVSGSVNGVAL
ncbi:hypothetical protein [Parahaliea mediterranea]|uniref:hypothetical protein n=1 Tax=Parahaliea mediterranea TaxID=651086 RepID=UPI000E2EE681|nr:hypothetical protein [Parahaliea mediterranea]